jgi:hypothetical protein
VPDRWLPVPGLRTEQSSGPQVLANRGAVGYTTPMTQTPTDRAYHQWCDQHRKMHGPCPEMTEIDRMARERRVGSARFDRARWTQLMDELHADALKINQLPRS